MANKPRSEAERLERVLDGLAEHITSAPGEELLEDARAEGRDPAETSARVRGILKNAFKQHQQRHLRAAMEGHQREAASINEHRSHLPVTKEKRRSWFMAAMQQLPQLHPAFTLQNRDFNTFSDEDIEKHLQKLELLGALAKVKLPEE